MPRKTKIDDIDRTIIKFLTSNWRVKNAELAAHLGMSASAIAARIAWLEKDGVLQGYTAIVGGQSLGLSEQMVRVQFWPERPAHRLGFEEAICTSEAVVSAKRLVGAGDYLLRGIGSDCIDAVYESAERGGVKIKALTTDAIDIELKPLRGLPLIAI